MHRIDDLVYVDVPLAECYKLWMQIERYPEYMRRIVSVTKLQAESHSKQPFDGVQHDTHELWHCVVRGPFGQPYSLNATLIYCEPEKCISWATFEIDSKADIASTGTVNFLRPPSERGEQTLIEITMSYSPSGPLAELLTDITAYGDNVVADCLQDFKQFAETEYRLRRDLQIEEVQQTSF
jgi:uncharacterized membrane protein